MKFPRELRPIVACARQNGWEVDTARNGHIRFRRPDGRAFFTSATPSDWRSFRNFRSQLRKEGLPLTTVRGR